MPRRYSSAPYPLDWVSIASRLKEKRGYCCEGCGHHGSTPGQILTVHHIDFNPANNDESNLLVLCQKCHLALQQGNPPSLIRLRYGQLLFLDVTYES